MKTQVIKLSDDVAEVLRSRIEIDGNLLRITGPRLDPKLYKQVDKVLKELGGKWTAGKTQAHVFPSPPGEALAAVLGDGEVVDRKKSYQFYATPAAVVTRMLELAEVEPGMEVLEPSAGNGDIVMRVLQKTERVTAIELDPDRIETLNAIDPTLNTYNLDFMGVTPEAKFDRVLMNPPFRGGQDIDHVMHAYRFLKPGGRLVAIVGNGALTNSTHKKALAFQKFVEIVGTHVEDLPHGTFKEAGTMVATNLIVLQA